MHTVAITNVAGWDERNISKGKECWVKQGGVYMAEFTHIEHSEATWACMATKHCEHMLVGLVAAHDEDWKCKCVGVYYGMAADGLDCSEWVACMDSRTGTARDALQNFMDLEVPAPLLQLSNGHHQLADLAGCVNPFTAPECGCDAAMLATCTIDGTVAMSEAQLLDCKVSLLCGYDVVCSSWKCALYADGARRCPGIDCTQSLLAVHDNGEAAKAKAAEGEVTTRPNNATNGAGDEMQNPLASRNASGKSVLELWAQEAHVTLIEDKLRSRRQPPGSASLTATLDMTVSGKCGSRTAR